MKLILAEQAISSLTLPYWRRVDRLPALAIDPGLFPSSKILALPPARRNSGMSVRLTPISGRSMC